MASGAMADDANAEALRAELRKLSPQQMRELLGASGHADLLRQQDAAAAGAQDEPQRLRANAELAAAAKSEGNACFREGRMLDAVDAYSRCIAIEPNNALCLSNRAAAYLKLKQYDHTIADCSNAIQLSPSIKPFMRRAAAYTALNQLECAAEDLMSALAFEPRNKQCCAKLQDIMDIALSASPLTASTSTANAPLSRRAAVRAAVALSIRSGWSPSAVRGNPGPSAVNGHALFQGADGRVYLFGGRAVREQKPELFVWDEQDVSSWDIVPTQGSTPHSRAWHTVSPIGDVRAGALCVYGGVSARGEDPTVHLLTPVSPRGFQWTQTCLEGTQRPPAARSGHAAVSVTNDRGHQAVYMFGGRTRHGVTSQLLILRTLEDTASAQQDEPVTLSWEEIQPPDEVWPSPRDGHSICLLTSTTRTPRLVVFGGNGQRSEDKLGDVWSLDLATQRWTRLQCSGEAPSPRSYHTAHAIGDFMLVVGGRTVETEDSGVFLLDTTTCEWLRVPVPQDRELSPRAWHASVLTTAGQLMVLGGGTYHGPLKDAAVLDLSYFQTHATKLASMKP